MQGMFFSLNCALQKVSITISSANTRIWSPNRHRTAPTILKVFGCKCHHLPISHITVYETRKPFYIVVIYADFKREVPGMQFCMLNSILTIWLICSLLLQGVPKCHEVFSNCSLFHRFTIGYLRCFANIKCWEKVFCNFWMMKCSKNFTAVFSS